MNYTAIIYSKEHAKSFISDKPHASRVYPLTPAAKSELVDNTNLQLLDPLVYFNDNSHKHVLQKLKSYESLLFPAIESSNLLSDAGKEALINIFHPTITATLYLKYLIIDTGPWIFYDGSNWIEINDHNVMFEHLFRYVIKERIGVFEEILEGKQKFPYLINFINSIIFKFFKNKEVIWTTGLNYGLKNLVKDLYLYNPNAVIFYYVFADKISWLRSIKSLIFSIFTRNKNEAIPIVPVRLENPSIPSEISEILSNIFKNDFKNIKKELIRFISWSVEYAESLIDYTSKNYKNYPPKFLLAHQLRLFDAVAIGYVAKKMNIPVHLISHGSHPVPDNEISEYELNYIARGLLFSPFASETIVQSPLAEKSAIDFMPSLKRKKFHPIMWGYNINKKDTINKENKFIILQAGTSKALSARPWIYENSNEFILGLTLLINAVKKINNAYLIIRIRESAEYNLKDLEIILPQSDKYELRIGGNFYDDLNEADLLVSYSSTTIEEALYSKKPVALFGGTDRYRHLSGMSSLPSFDNRSAVYHLSKDNLFEMIQEILKVHSNKPLTNLEVSKYIWSQEVPGRQEFIKHLFNE